MHARVLTFASLLALAAVVVAFFGPTLWGGGSLVPTDILHQIVRPYGERLPIPRVQNHYASDALVADYPWALFWQHSVRNGQLPLWNPYILGGHLHMADSMPTLFSPFKLLLLFGDAERAFSLSIILQFVIAAFSMFAFLRETGRSHFAAALGAAAWALNSGFLMWYWRVPAIFCFAPLVLLLLSRTVRQRSWAYGGSAAIVLGSALLSGNVQAEAHLGLLCGSYAVACVRWHGRQGDRWRWGRMALVLVFGGLIATVHWLPTLVTLPHDAYGATTARGPLPGLRHTLLGLPMLVTFVFPGLTGSTESFDLLKLAGASRADFTGYIGVVPFGLALAAALASRGRQTRFWVGLIVTVLLLVFFTPLVKYLYHRIFIVVAFAMAVLAAEGADLALSPTEEQRKAIRRAMRILLWMCVGVLLIVVALQTVIVLKRPAIAEAARRYVLARADATPLGFKREWLAARAEWFLDNYRIANPLLWLPVLCGVGVAVAWRLRERQRVGRSMFAVLLGATTLVDLWVLGRPLVPQCDLRRFPLSVAHPLLPKPPPTHDLFRVHRWAKDSFFLFRPNLMLLAGLHDLGGAFSLSPPTVESLPSVGADGLPNRLLDLQNVRYVWQPASATLPSERFERVAEADGYVLYRNRTCLPRAWWVPRAETVSNREELWRRLLAKDFDPKTVVLLEEPPVAATAGTAGDAEVRITRYTPLQVDVTVRAEAEGWLVLSETWDAGWRARVDGQPTKLHRANWVLRAVFVPCGQHVVRFEFTPVAFSVGLGVSLTAAWGAVWVAAFGRWFSAGAG